MEGKLDDTVLSKYLGDLWQTISSEKKESQTILVCNNTHTRAIFYSKCLTENI